jgi:hypothetical protein
MKKIQLLIPTIVKTKGKKTQVLPDRFMLCETLNSLISHVEALEKRMDKAEAWEEKKIDIAIEKATIPVHEEFCTCMGTVQTNTTVPCYWCKKPIKPPDDMAIKTPKSRLCKEDGNKQLPESLYRCLSDIHQLLK